MDRRALTIVPPPAPPPAVTEALDAFEIAAELSRVAAKARAAGWRVTFATDLAEGAEYVNFSASRGGV